ncbi:MAG: hypothetical protein HYS38_10010 [Acidobacteria bacterium]|nr:hypothetical protein [Acidobacteriota bacterium]
MSGKTPDSDPPAEKGYYFPAGAIFDKLAAYPWDDGIQVDKMEELTQLVIRTVNSVYEITVLDGRSGDILVRGGKFFPELIPAHLAGATFGGCFCKMRGIYLGLHMEICINRRRIITTPVQTIAIVIGPEPDAPEFT